MRALLVTIFERYNLAYLDAVPVKAYPQDHIILVLFLLSRAARDWQPPERLARLASLPTAIPPEEEIYDPLRTAFELRALRHLTWFGLMEQQTGEPSADLLPPRLYRVTPLFDRALRFDLPGLAGSAPLH